MNYFMQLILQILFHFNLFLIFLLELSNGSARPRRPKHVKELKWAGPYKTIGLMGRPDCPAHFPSSNFIFLFWQVSVILFFFYTFCYTSFFFDKILLYFLNTLNTTIYFISFKFVLYSQLPSYWLEISKILHPS
jgi:hypothetical protein